MEIRFVHRFPCSPDVYWRTTRDPAFEVAVRRDADVDFDILEAVEEGARSFSRVRVSPRRELPALVQKALGTARFSYVQEVEGDSSAFSTRWKVVTDVLKDKFRCSGTSVIVEDPEGCERVIAGNIDVAIPIFGSAIERQIVGEIARSFDRAADVLRRHLDQSTVVG